MYACLKRGGNKDIIYQSNIGARFWTELSCSFIFANREGSDETKRLHMLA